MKYLLAVDNSEPSLRAFDYLMDEIILKHGDTSGDEVFLLSIAQEVHSALGLGGLTGDWVAKANAEVVSKAEKTLEDFSSKADEKGVKVTTVIGKGKTREEIIHKCSEYDVDMLICGTRGLGTVKRAMLGSVSDYLVKNAPCPVLVVHPKVTE